MTGYPAHCGRTHRIAECPPNAKAVLAGRLTHLDGNRGMLWDETGTLAVCFATVPEIRVCDIVELHGAKNGDAFYAETVHILAPALRTPAPMPSVQNLRLRARILSGIRRFFDAAGFLEVETPLLVRCPGQEPHLNAFETSDEGERFYLPTSPEYAMKRLLSAGFERIYQLCKSFRREPHGRLHNPEFTMLEWYRAYADGRAIMADAEGLIAHLATDLFREPILRYGAHTIDLTPPYERLSVHDALRYYARIEADPFADPGAFIGQARALGYTHVLPDDAAEVAFFKVFLDAVERHLGTSKPTFLIDYPAEMAALAKCKSDAPHLADRFELYIAGIELANAFTELNDPVEQYARLKAEARQRAAAQQPAYPIDARFLAALEAGMPPSGGIALGVDRLVMLLVGAGSVGEVMAFPFPDV